MSQSNTWAKTPIYSASIYQCAHDPWTPLGTADGVRGYKVNEPPSLPLGCAAGAVMEGSRDGYEAHAGCPAPV